MQENENPPFLQIQHPTMKHQFCILSLSKNSVLAFLVLFHVRISTVPVGCSAWMPQLPNDSFLGPPAPPTGDANRRRLLLETIVAPMALLGTATALVASPPDMAQAAAERAVGSAEIACRAAGNCLQVGEWDGAVGWGWGGKDRCDATDPLCGTDGQLRTTALVGKPVPPVPDALRFTHVAAIQIEIGRGEVGVLKLGLYGNEAPDAVSQMVDFLSAAGLNSAATWNQQHQQPKNSFVGLNLPTVSLPVGGVVTGIVPNALVEFGVPLQSNAFARSTGRSKAGDSFRPQPRPPALRKTEGVVRRHDCAGLVSVPEQGLGYGGTGFESDDECFESAFLLTADAEPLFDKPNNGKTRRVVGQVLDADSMAFLERLANIPTKRGIRGVIPGQTSGPPLPRVVVQQVQVSKVAPG